MDKTYRPGYRGRIATPAKKKAPENRGLDNNNALNTGSHDSTIKPESLIQSCSHLHGHQRRLALSKAFSTYWQAMLGGDGHD